VNAAGHSKELLVIDNVKLWCEVVCSQIVDEANQGGMVAREAKKLAKAHARAPLGNFVVILEFWIQDISRAAKNLHAAQVLAVKASATKELHGGKTAVTSWCVVIEPHSIIHGKWPQLNVIFIWPVDRQMKHHGTSHVLDGFYGTLGQTILMVCANTGNSVTLVGSKEGVAELGFCKNTIVSVVVIHIDTTMGCLPFKLGF